MAFITIDDDIGIQLGTFAFSFKASGSIEKGQAVRLVDDNTVAATSAGNQDAIGIADYDASDGEMVAIYCAGNIVRCGISGSSIPSVGATVGAYKEGYLSGDSTGRNCGIVVEAPSSNPGVGKVLLI
ncbi:MAG: hypothetical protein DRP62_00090 [Planctomycetota bacterium]|nr:MAG: hypothetical protein DRP62_00090 [Planctomycetota bacterium]